MTLPTLAVPGWTAPRRAIADRIITGDHNLALLNRLDPTDTAIARTVLQAADQRLHGRV